MINNDITAQPATTTMAPNRADLLARIPTQWANPPAELVSTLPKGGTKLDYMGHADITLALISIDPNYEYGWLTNTDGTMLIQDKGKRLVLEGWVKVHGHTHRGVGTCESNKFEPEKELIGDLLRNCAMRFGFATSLWSKSEQFDWAAQSAPVEPVEPVKPVDPEFVAAFETMKSLVATLDEQARADLNMFWADYSDGRAKPSMANPNLADVEALITEITRLTLGGDLVDDAA